MSQNPDFHYVPEDQKAIDARLENWASYVRVKSPSWVSPIWKLGRSGGRQWHQPEFRPACDVLDGMVLEKAVFKLPEPHRAAIRWAYVYRRHPAEFCKAQAMSKATLAILINDGRRMLINRKV